MRKEFDQLLSINEAKTKQLTLLQEQLANTENATDLATLYTNNTGFFGIRTDLSRNDTRPDTSPSIKIHNISHLVSEKKFTGSHYSMNEVIKPDQLYERLNCLKDSLAEIEIRTGNEKEITDGIDNKLKELKKDSVNFFYIICNI